MKTTWGTMAPPLGLKRVKIVDLLATLLSSHNDDVATAVLDSKALPVCCELFARYPFNNFLHHHVESMMTSILEWGHPALLAHLFASKQEGGCDVIGLVTEVGVDPPSTDRLTDSTHNHNSNKPPPLH